MRTQVALAECPLVFRWAFPAAVAWLLAATVQPAFVAADDQPGQAAGASSSPLGASWASELAKQLLAPIEPPASIALRPLRLGGSANGLPRDVADEISGDLLAAVDPIARTGGLTVQTRALQEVYESLGEFLDDTDITTLLRNARADIEIICEAAPYPEGLKLSCQAVRLREAHTVSTGNALAPVRRQAAPLDLAITMVAERIVQGASERGETGELTGGVHVTENRFGKQGSLGAHISDRLEIEVIARMAERKRREERGSADAAVASNEAAPAPSYRLTGLIREVDDQTVYLIVRLKQGVRTLVATGTDVTVASLPRDMIDKRPDDGTRLYEAVAEAVISARLDRNAALRAARNLARARVVALALGLPPPDVVEVTTEAAAVAVLESLLNEGIPVDERWFEVTPQGDSLTEERVAVGLAARVVPLGAALRPQVDARLDKKVYRAGEPIIVKIGSRSGAFHVGVFAWGADNRVVRLYPKGQQEIRVDEGTPLLLPRPGEASIRSAPLPQPGNVEDHEAFIVVATQQPADLIAVAPTVGASIEETQSRAVSGAEFFAGLAGLDVASMAVVVLPYHVHDTQPEQTAHRA